MTDDVAGLLDDLRAELAFAVDDLERTRAAHRGVETVLTAILDHVPSPVVVVDEELRVRALSATAEGEWDVRLDAPLSSSDTLDECGLADALRAAMTDGRVESPPLPEPFAGAVVVEPGTGARYAVVWDGGDRVGPAHG